MSNINDTYFDGYYKEIWRSVMPARLTDNEIKFLETYFKLSANSSVLDLMCGYGRHALALSRKGISVTAVDNLAAYIDEIKTTAANEKLTIQAQQKNVLEFNASEDFDLAICMGNSFNFFARPDAERLLQIMTNALKPGGHLLINSWSVAEIQYANPLRNNWKRIDEKLFLNEFSFQLHPSRVEAVSTILLPDGTKEEKKGVDYIYSLNEMEDMIKAVGCDMRDVFSIPGSKSFQPGDPIVYIVAVKK
ncbi:MAG: class I SAM-dependent methyltransferase [Chitinophagaceae bacterium]|nr:class I SAM-dependent methyltransferase [Chitinophagaceae bacterium]